MGNRVSWFSNKSKDEAENHTCSLEPGPRKRKSSVSSQEILAANKRPREDTPSSSAVLQPEQENEDKESQSGVKSEPDRYEDMANIKLKDINLLFSRLGLGGELKLQDFLQLTSLSLQWHEPNEEKNLVQTFIQRLIMMDYRARYIAIREEPSSVLNTQRTTSFDIRESFAFENIFKRPAPVNEPSRRYPIHPMDLQMAVFLCADHFLRQLMVTKLSQCQYALPLLVPNPFTQEIEFPLWTFRQIKKSWKSHLSDISKNQAILKTEKPMVAFFRFSEVSSSKSELMNNLINERHETFFHRHCRGSSKSRLLMDGVVEIAWYCPSGEKTEKFTDCVAFCNLHGDARANKTQLQILTKESSVNVVLLPNLDRADKCMAVVEELYKSAKPLICLLTEDDSGVTEMQNGKYKIGLKDRNKSDVSEEVRRTVNECLLKTATMFKLYNLVSYSAIKVDENHNECRYGHMEAKKMMRVLERMDLLKIKETFLPCQGKLWQQWCLKNKELHRPKGNNIEMYASQKQTEMQQLREKQKASGISVFVKPFIEKLKSRNCKEKAFFLKWTEILMDEFTSEDLCKVHREYDQKWSKVLDLKKKHKTGQLAFQQTQLENLSKNLTAATFGLEHVLREIGQIYESDVSVTKNKGSGCKLHIGSLPRLAAELMISGYPLELMDGDAAHVPLIWVQAVLDALIRRLGDQRVFVLSVLGIQSTGKSTLLNAMFGLQFAVSAGRCTRGAFVQLVKVSEELKTQLNFDYILVVDTEGLRALELAGRSTRHHDNEMATFVVGLGNMTLINIFGENPAEMQDILQIVVQAFLRMRKISLNPSCMFVHQNVGDITAGDKNMVGKRRLQEKLDEMTQLAAKEEVCVAECFSDVIKFDIKTDVRYFAQLWEGSPPMAPPNPCYSENVQELRSKILLHASKCSDLTLSQFKHRLGDLWNALLNENFVFSFKNTFEIAVYRKLEEEYAKWTWSLRSAMLEIEDKLHNRINNRKLHKIEIQHLKKEISKTNAEVNNSIKDYFDKHREREMLIQWRSKFQEKIKHLHEELVRDAKRRLENIIYQRETLANLDRKKSLHEKNLLEKSKDLAFILKKKGLDHDQLKEEFDSVWENWVSQLAGDVRPLEDLNVENDIITIISEIHEEALVHDRLNKYESINQLTDYTIYVNLTKELWNPCLQNSALPLEDQESIKHLVHNITRATGNLVKSKSVAKMGYNTSYIQEIALLVKTNVENHKFKFTKYKFKKEFTVDLMILACKQAGEMFAMQHQEFRNANDPMIYLEKKKPEYYSVFQGFCRGATSAAIFGALICSELKEPILQSVYDKTGSDLAGEMRTNIPAFRGNRSNLEKHILRALAEEEDFQKFFQYIHFPRDQFEDFIKAEVKAYINEGNSSALAMIKGNIKHKVQSVISAAETATAQVLRDGGEANMWLEIFSDCLKDELEYNKEHLTGNCCEDIIDFELLEQVVKKELRPVIETLNKRFKKPSNVKMEKFRKPPDEILIEHFCQCCWVQCPFCKAICVNTMEDHAGDHIVPFHRNCGMKGMIYKGTTNLCLNFCTSSVASDTKRFYPIFWRNETVLWKEYRTAGPPFANWCITPDLSELPYWKWFVCRFQDELEKSYDKTFSGYGEIPKEWRSYTKQKALESLEKYL